MQRHIFCFSILMLGCFLILSGCTKKEEPLPAPAPAPMAAPAPEAPAAPAPPGLLPESPAPAVQSNTQKEQVRAAHKDFVKAFNEAMRIGTGMDSLQARIQAAENAREACVKLRGEIDDPAEMDLLNKFIDSLQDYADKGHAYVSKLEEADKLLSQIKEGDEELKTIQQKEQAQAITKLNEKKIRYNDLYKDKGTLPKQRDELDALGKELMSMDKAKG